VFAEFVESIAILDELRAIGVDYVQGYAIGKPVPVLTLREEKIA
jgi:EAL domain-containing protein (putative c-di-GMP-specific phosphodiesterase class I)